MNNITFRLELISSSGVLSHADPSSPLVYVTSKFFLQLLLSIKSIKLLV